MDQATARYIRPIERSEPSLTLGEGADMSAGMGQRGIAYGNECLSVMLVSVSHA